jgi:hypothetical protein
MSTDSTTPSPKRVGFFGMLLAFTGFAVLLVVIQAIGGSETADPRGEERWAARAEIQEAQDKLVDQLGLTDEKKIAALFEKTAAELSQKKPAKSSQVVPGSPTQMNMAAEEAAKAAAAAPPAEEAKAEEAAPPAN